jgi:pimeloyl-ACP methyl ester carboxylesterase
MFDAAELRRSLEHVGLPMAKADVLKLIDQLLSTSLPRLVKDLEEMKTEVAGMSDSTPPPDTLTTRIALATLRDGEKFGALQSPTLALFASPHDLGPAVPGMDPAQRAAAEAIDTKSTAAQVAAFRKTNPAARVVEFPHASHAIFASNEAEVLREIDAFIATLK